MREASVTSECKNPFCTWIIWARTAPTAPMRRRGWGRTNKCLTVCKTATVSTRKLGRSLLRRSHRPFSAWNCPRPAEACGGPSTSTRSLSARLWQATRRSRASPCSARTAQAPSLKAPASLLMRSPTDRTAFGRPLGPAPEVWAAKNRSSWRSRLCASPATTIQRANPAIRCLRPTWPSPARIGPATSAFTVRLTSTARRPRRRPLSTRTPRRRKRRRPRARA